jgi:hypothetical protein
MVAARLRAPSVLDRVLTDLEPDAVERLAPDRARCSIGGHRCGVVATVRSKMLLTLVTTSVTVEGTAGTAGSAPSEVRLAHRGQLRRGSLTARVRGGGDDARAMADRVASNDGIQRACQHLDFTRFWLHVPTPGAPWRATVALMGGSYVATRVPPSGRYISLDAEQRRALADLVGALHVALATP